MNDQDYSSDTSDEDFVPNVGEEALSEEGSGEDSHAELSDGADEPTNAQTKRKSKKERSNDKDSRKKRKVNPLLANIEELNKSVEKTDKDCENIEETPRNKTEDGMKNNGVKEDSGRTKDLWADFLADVEEKPKETPKPKSKTSWAQLLGNKKKTSQEKISNDNDKTKKNDTSSKSSVLTKPKSEASTVKVTQIFEFAGEAVKVEKEVHIDSIEARTSLEANAQKSKTDEVSESPKNMKKGLSSVMNILEDKKKKLSTLQKTKLDWENFKSEEGIEDDLKSHLKSKDGYLEKQAFLERADLKQFEIERNLRIKNKSNRN